MRRTVGPLQINRQSQQPAVTISFNLAPDMSLGQAIDEIHALERKVESARRASSPAFAGNAQLFQQALAGQGALLLAAVLTIYILLGVLYESYIHPITILSGLPSAGIGALLALELLPYGPLGDRDHRHSAADRHRQEERDHDGRFRAGAPARGRLDARDARSARRR